VRRLYVPAKLRKHRRIVLIVGVLLSMALAACSSKSGGATTSASNSTGTQSLLTVNLNATYTVQEPFSCDPAAMLKLPG